MRGQPAVRRGGAVSLSHQHPVRDLPVRFGHWKNVHQRFSRWAKPQSLNAMVAAASLRRSALADVKE
jgi:transposase